MRISDWSSDVCSSDLANRVVGQHMVQRFTLGQYIAVKRRDTAVKTGMPLIQVAANEAEEIFEAKSGGPPIERARGAGLPGRAVRSEERRAGKACVSTWRARSAL